MTRPARRRPQPPKLLAPRRGKQQRPYLGTVAGIIPAVATLAAHSPFFLFVLMKFRCLTLALVASLAFAAPALAQVAAPVWYTALPAALAQAQATQRPVLAVFSGSDWCKPCMLLKQEVFDQPEFSRLCPGQVRAGSLRLSAPEPQKPGVGRRKLKLNEASCGPAQSRNGAFPLAVVLGFRRRAGCWPAPATCPGGPASAYDSLPANQLLAKQ